MTTAPSLASYSAMVVLHLHREYMAAAAALKDQASESIVRLPPTSLWAFGWVRIMAEDSSCCDPLFANIQQKY